MRRFKLDWKNIAIGSLGTVVLSCVPVVGDTISSFIASIRKKVGGN